MPAPNKPGFSQAAPVNITHFLRTLVKSKGLFQNILRTALFIA